MKPHAIRRESLPLKKEAKLESERFEIIPRDSIKSESLFKELC
jgi:hypothetical protein